MKCEFDRTTKGAYIVKVKHELDKDGRGVVITSGNAPTLPEAASWCLRNMIIMFAGIDSMLRDLGASDIGAGIAGENDYRQRARRLAQLVIAARVDDLKPSESAEMITLSEWIVAGVPAVVPCARPAHAARCGIDWRGCDPRCPAFIWDEAERAKDIANGDAGDDADGDLTRVEAEELASATCGECGRRRDDHPVRHPFVEKGGT